MPDPTPLMNKFLITVFLATLAVIHALAADAPRRPNVLLIMTDDQGFGDAGFQGNPVLKTPALDALAKGGVRFTDFLASPTCSPTRAALMTGRHEFRSNVTHTIEGRNILRDGVPTMADAFRQAGYRTAIFGKWHLGETHPFHPLDRGFDHALILGGGATGQTPDFWGNTMFDPHLQENGVWKPFQGYMTDIFVDEAARWIQKNREPWFCYIPLNAPHTPLQVDDKWSAPYTAMGLRENVAKFYGMITQLDSRLGILLDSLAKNGMDRDTVIIFLGDNGSAMGGHMNAEDFNGGLRASKGSPYQGGVRVPAVFSWAGHFASGASVNTLASVCDVLPTLQDVCALNLSKFPQADGRSLLPILLAGRQPADWSDRTISTHVARWPSGTKAENLPFASSSIRNQRFSLVNGKELYDLESDPGQKTDISKENPDTVESLRSAYINWWDGVKDEAMALQPLVLGRPGQGAVELTCMDWQPSRATNEPMDSVWDQSSLGEWTAGRKSSGTDGAIGGWMVNVETPGIYSIEIRQRPGASEESLPFFQGEATLAMAGQTVHADIPKGATTATLQIELPAGPQFLEPVLSGQRSSGKPQGAYFCTVKKIEPNR